MRGVPFSTNSAHHVVVAAAGVLVERRAIGLGPQRRRQMAHPARLCEHLAAELLLVSEIVGRLLASAPWAQNAINDAINERL